MSTRARNKEGGGGLPKASTLDSVPGPSAIDNIKHLWRHQNLDILTMLSNFGKRYGPIFRFKAFGETFVVLNSAPLAQTLLGSKDIGHLTKSPMVYDFTLGEILGNGLITSNETVMGLDTSRNPTDTSNFNESIQRLKDITFQRSQAPWLFFKPVWKLYPLSRKYYKAVETVNSITKRMIGNFKCTDETKEFKHVNADEVIEQESNMIKCMIDSGMSEEDIIDELKTMIVAGFETVSSAVNYLLFMLVVYQKHQQACRQEVDEIFNDPLKCPDGELNIDALSELRYFERCLMETLRLYPVALSMTRKLDVPLRLNDEQELSCGTNVVVLTFTLHKNPEYFPEPEIFDPDRFLPENCRNRHPCAFVPFSAGPRNCIGMKFATLEAKTMVAHILRNFEVYTTDSINDVRVLAAVALTPERDYNFILKRRVQ